MQVTENMVGHKLGEFSLTRKLVVTAKNKKGLPCWAT